MMDLPEPFTAEEIAELEPEGTMKRDEALRLLWQYGVEAEAQAGRGGVLYSRRKGLSSVSGMYVRFPKDGSEAKAMRWLGYAQGVLVAYGVFTLEQVKTHSKNKTLAALLFLLALAACGPGPVGLGETGTDTGGTGGGCAAPLIDCDGECVDIELTAEHCGSCGNACGPGETCVEYVCG